MKPKTSRRFFLRNEQKIKLEEPGLFKSKRLKYEKYFNALKKDLHNPASERIYHRAINW